MIDVRNWFLLNILRMDGQNSTKFCIHMIISKIYSQRNLKSAFFSAKREKSKREIDNFSEKQREKGEISRRNFSAFRGEISRRFAAKMVIMTWVLKMYSPRFAAKLKP